MSNFIHDGEAIFEVEPIYEDDELTIVRISLCGLNRIIRNEGSTTTYRITTGEGMMVVDGQEIFLRPGVEVVVEQGSEYYDVGNFEGIAISKPPFDESKVVLVED